LEGCIREGYDLSKFPKSWLVNLYYYWGRFYLYSNCLEESRNYLINALDLCHVDHIGNKKKILRFLIPIEINKDNNPSFDLLDKYGLKNEFGEIVKAVV